jgi:hypothetical protein
MVMIARLCYERRVERGLQDGLWRAWRRSGAQPGLVYCSFTNVLTEFLLRCILFLDF